MRNHQANSLQNRRVGNEEVSVECNTPYEPFSGKKVMRSGRQLRGGRDGELKTNSYVDAPTQCR